MLVFFFTTDNDKRSSGRRKNFTPKKSSVLRKPAWATGNISDLFFPVPTVVKNEEDMVMQDC